MRMPSMSGAAVVAATLASGILFATTASAEALDYAFDRVHTQVHASVTHMGMSNSTARFHVKDGTIRFDPDNIAGSSVDVVLAADSLDLGDSTWNEHVSAEKWLNVAAFPQMRFVSTEVRSTGEKTFDILGELTLKGQTAPVTLHATLNKAGPHPFSSKPAAGFSATASFQRSAFGVSEFIPGISDEVTVRIEVEASAAS